ncbi:unnamed protein product [Allacma fusca]|uniref:Uncharacterized protein n=1 Tax=Allacma fusca TaxID=39272 RepID=A0A8J2NN76_9HEXA|nr:unnamed protein product [Allacma fusca]
MNNLGSSEKTSSPRDRNSFFDCSRPQSPGNSCMSPLSTPDEKLSKSKAKSIFTLSGSYSSKHSTDPRKKKSLELLNIVSEVNSLAKSNSNLSYVDNDSRSREPEVLQHSESSFETAKLDSLIPSRRAFQSKSMPSKTEDGILTPPQTPPSFKSNTNADSGSRQQRQRHNSLENLHRPKNHRSSTKSSKKRKPMDMDCDNISNCSSRTPHECVTVGYPNQSKSYCMYEERRNLASRAATAFALGAVRKLSSKVAQLEEKQLIKERESAARLILRGLLLNSWRQCRGQNEKLIRENSANLRTIENMCLQLRVIRQMHREEKEKSQSRSVQVSSMAIQITELKDERNKIQTELEKVENELNNCQVYVESLGSTNEDLQQQKNKLQKTIALVEREKQEEIKKVMRLEMEHVRLQDLLAEVKQQNEEENKQKVRWQEESRGKDSEIYTLKSDLESKEKQINKIQSCYQEIKQEIEHHQSAKQKLQKEKLKLHDQLSSAAEEIKSLHDKLIRSEEEVKTQSKISLEAAAIIEKKDAAITEIRKNLCLYMSDGIERRRRWANAFHYVVFPLDIIRLILDVPQESSYSVDLRKINAAC